MDLLDNLSIALSKRFNKTISKYVLITQYICLLYREDHIPDHCLDVEEYDETKKESSKYIDGMTENLHCKNAFELPDEYNHEFINTISDNNTLFYQFGIFLHGESHKEIPTKVYTLVDHFEQQLKAFWSSEMKLSFKKKYYFTQSKEELKKNTHSIF